MKDNDIIVAGISGGKDSTALALWLVFESGIPREQISLEFCDTGNEDALTYSFLGYLESIVGEIVKVYPDEDFWELAIRKRRFPSARARFCTQELKIRPSHRRLAEWIDAGYKPIKATGIRHDEGHSGNRRGDVSEYEWDAFAIGKEPYAYRVWHPIREWSLSNVWAIHERYLSIDAVIGLVNDDPKMGYEQKQTLINNIKQSGVARNQVYDMGAVRVGCFPCIMSRKSELRSMAYYRPERIDEISAMESGPIKDRSNFNYSSMFHRRTVPMSFRSKVLKDHNTGEVVIDEQTGEPMLVCTINDVVEWSKTKHGGKQYEIYFPEEQPDTCLIGGECE